MVVAVAAVLAVIAFGATAVLGSTGMPFLGSMIGVMCIPVLVFVVILIFAIVSASRRRTIPPPPPIQQPMVPAGQQGPVALDCPNCGGPPSNVDRFGIAICAYCGTRFLVR